MVGGGQEHPFCLGRIQDNQTAPNRIGTNDPSCLPHYLGTKGSSKEVDIQLATPWMKASDASLEEENIPRNLDFHLFFACLFPAEI